MLLHLVLAACIIIRKLGKMESKNSYANSLETSMKDEEVEMKEGGSDEDMSVSVSMFDSLPRAPSLSSSCMGSEFEDAGVSI